jgi:hypothetical protein
MATTHVGARGTLEQRSVPSHAPHGTPANVRGAHGGVRVSVIASVVGAVPEGVPRHAVLALIGATDGTVGLMVAFAVAAGGFAVYRYLRRRRKRDDLHRLLERDPRIRRTVIPCGLRPDQIAWWCRGLPAGDRNQGLEYGVEGPMEVDLGPEPPREVTVAAFQWWYEERRRNRNSSTITTTTSYTKRRLPATLVKLPVHVDHRILIRPESVLGRVGLTRGGRQVESSEFNRRFRVEARQEQLSVYLLDPGFQQLLVEHFEGRTIEIFGELLLVAGSPNHRDDSLTGVIGELPAMRQDALRILRAIPAAFWRRIPSQERP